MSYPFEFEAYWDRVSQLSAMNKHDAYLRWLNAHKSVRATKKKRPKKTRRYEDYIKSPQWRKRVSQAVKLHDGKCAICHCRKPLQGHHIHYKTLGREDPAKDILPVCRDCHENIHEAQGKCTTRTTREFIEKTRDWIRVD